MLFRSKYDVVIDAMSITPERQAQVDFTDPYFTNTLVFLTKQGSPINPDDLAQIDSMERELERLHNEARLRTAQQQAPR